MPIPPKDPGQSGTTGKADEHRPPDTPPQSPGRSLIGEIDRMPFRTGPKDEEDRKFDYYAHAVTVMDEPHRLTHDGMVFHVSGKITGILDAGVQDFLIVTPAGVFPHMQRFNISAGGGDVDVILHEGTTTSADGTVVPTFTTNRNSSKVAGTVITIDPTVTGVGTVISTQWIPPTAAGVGQTHDGVSEVNEGEEWIAKPSTKYLLRLTNNSGTTIDLRYEVLWYELSYGT